MTAVSIEPKPGYYEVRRERLVAYVRRGWVLIRCGGDAHLNGGQACPLCDGQPWGWRAVRG